MMVEEKLMAEKTLGEKNYDAYGNAVGWKNFQGNPIPAWNDLTDSIRGGWQAGAEAIAHEIGSLPSIDENTFDDRDRNMIHFALEYQENHSHTGIIGHATYILMAKLVKLAGLA